MDDVAAMFPPSESAEMRPEPDWEEVHRELRRGKRTTRRLLWGSSTARSDGVDVLPQDVPGGLCCVLEVY